MFSLLLLVTNEEVWTLGVLEQFQDPEESSFSEANAELGRVETWEETQVIGNFVGLLVHALPEIRHNL